MDDNLHDIDDLFKDSIEPLNDTPTGRIWENITAKLDADDAKKYKRKFIIAKRLASVLFLLLLILLIFDYVNIGNKNILLTKQQVVRLKKDSYASDVVKQNGAAIHQLIQLSKAESQKNPKSDKIYYNNQGVRATRFYTEAISRKDINKEFDLGLIHPVVSNILLAKLPAVSANTITEVNVKPMPKLILHENKNSLKFKPSLDYTILGSAVWAKYSLQDDVQENVFAQSTIQNSLQAGSQNIDKSIIEERENPELSFNAGIFVNYNFRKHLTFQTGLMYNRNYISIQPQEVYATPDASGNIAYKLITSSGYGFVNPDFSNAPTIGDSLLTTTVQHNLQYFSIPLLLKYNLSIHKLTFSPGLGVSVNFLTSSSIRTELENSRSRETVFLSRLQGTRFIHFSLLANADIKYAFNSKWALDLIPGFSYAVTPVTRNSVVKTYPYNFSFGIGINYKLN